jgi:hypothetical protein
MTYIPFPDISPEIFAIDIGPVTLALRWYALAYIVGLIAGWKLIVRMITTPPRGPGTAPLTSTTPRSASALTTCRLRVVTWSAPMRPAMRMPLNTRAGVAHWPTAP